MCTSSILVIPPWYLEPGLGDHAIVSGVVSELHRRSDVSVVDVLHYGPSTAFARFFEPPLLPGARLVRFGVGFCDTPGCAGPEELSTASDRAFVAELDRRNYSEVLFAPGDTLDGYYNCVHSQLQLRRAAAAARGGSRRRRVRILGCSFDEAKATAQCPEAIRLLQRLPRAVSLCARDAPTFEYLSSVVGAALPPLPPGAPRQVRLVADAAFAVPLDATSAIAAASLAWIDSQRAEGCVVIGLNANLHYAAALGHAYAAAVRAHHVNVSVDVNLAGRALGVVDVLASSDSISTVVRPFCENHVVGSDDCGAIVAHLERERRRLALAAHFSKALDALAREFDGKLALLLLPHDFRERQSDLTMAHALLDALPPDLRARARIVSDVPYRSAEVKAICKRCDFALSGRMHLAIACLGVGTPTAVMSHQNKYGGLLAHFGLSPHAMLIDSAEALQPERLVRFLLSRVKLAPLAAQRKAIEAQLPRIHQLCRRAFEWGDDVDDGVGVGVTASAAATAPPATPRGPLPIRLQRVRIAAHSHWAAVEDLIVARLGSDPVAAEGLPILISFLEMHFYKDGKAVYEPWAGIVHDPIATRDFVRGRDLLSSTNMLASLPSCCMLFVLAASEIAPLQHRLATLGFVGPALAIPVRLLHHPYRAASRAATTIVAVAAGGEASSSGSVRGGGGEDSVRTIVQIGYWLRRTWSIFALRAPSRWRKEILPWDNRTRDELQRTVQRDGISLSATQLESVVRRKRISEMDYAALLAGSPSLRTVVLLDVYAATANNVLLECVHAHTPILLRRTPAFIEILGPRYPLFFDSFIEAAALLGSDAMLESAVRHLQSIDVDRFRSATFLRELARHLSELSL